MLSCMLGAMVVSHVHLGVQVNRVATHLYKVLLAAADLKQFIMGSLRFSCTDRNRIGESGKFRY